MILSIATDLQSFFDRNWYHVLVDIADIAIVSFLFYRILLLIRGTRAMQLGVGFGLVFLVYQAAKRIGLVTLYSLLNSLLTYVVLLVIIVFQHDIRRALMRVGRNPLFQSGRSAREHHVIEETVKAAAQLAQKRIGALMVFERDASLNDFIQPGTLLDANVTHELLYSIFIPSFENPMHDGAVIIREDRIWQAGAFLPLTASPRLDRTLGTRHRAAMGLSEETDAVVVVVSEERGAIGLCFNGNMIRNLDSDSLRVALQGLFYNKPRRKHSKSDVASRMRGQASETADSASSGTTSSERQRTSKVASVDNA